jgi:mercuric ion transport protein
VNRAVPSVQPPRQNTSQRWFVAAIVSSIVSALLASACCIGPLVLALLGIGSVGVLVALKPYQPYFVGLTFVFLGTGFCLTYRKIEESTRRPKSNPRYACPAPAASAGAIMLWIATILVASLLVFPRLAPYVFD